MKLATALKEKNKLTKKISEIQKFIEQNNSVIKGNTRSFDVEKLMATLVETTDRLIVVKSVITGANQPICRHIIRIGEIRSSIAFLRKLKVTNGISSEGYRGTVTEYEARYKQEDVAQMITDKETELEGLQNIIDAHNYSTEVDL